MNYLNMKNIKVEVNASLPKNAIMLIAPPPTDIIFDGYKEMIDWYIKHFEKVVIASNLEVK